MSRSLEFTAVQMERMLRTDLSHSQLAREFGCSTVPIRTWRARESVVLTPEASRPGPRPIDGGPQQKAPLGVPGRVDKDGESTVTTKPVLASLVADAGGAEAYLRETWGFADADWYCVSATGNQWEGPRAGGDTVVYAQVKGSFRPVKALADLIPTPAVWHGPKYSIQPMDPHAAGRTIVVLGDHQAPYYDERLHLSTLTMIEALQPEQIVHLGDLCDYTNISKHRDHAVVKAAVDECTQSGVDILVSLREVAPTAQFDMLAGNHDVRPLTELLSRAERMAGIRCAALPGEEQRDELLSLRALWRLDDLGITLHEDPRGWDHAEVELVPGPYGLVAIHGYLTGNNVAGRTLDKVGRSVIMGHTHGPEHVYRWSKQLQAEQQAVVAGCQCAVRGESHHFPTFAPNDGWLQGPVLVHVHEGGEFAIQRVRWNGESLIAGYDRWAA